MPESTQNMKVFQPQLILLDIARHRQELDRMRRIRYLELGAGLLMGAGYLLRAYIWGGWPW